jgi:hypothetical protein
MPMAESLQAVWDSAAGSPFSPLIGKDTQFTVGFLLLSLGIVLTGYFGLSKSAALLRGSSSDMRQTVRF